MCGYVYYLISEFEKLMFSLKGFFFYVNQTGIKECCFLFLISVIDLLMHLVDHKTRRLGAI